MLTPADGRIWTPLPSLSSIRHGAPRILFSYCLGDQKFISQPEKKRLMKHLCSQKLTMSQGRWLRWEKYVTTYAHKVGIVRFTCHCIVYKLLAKYPSFASGSDKAFSTGSREIWCSTRDHQPQPVVSTGRICVMVLDTRGHWHLAHK